MIERVAAGVIVGAMCAIPAAAQEKSKPLTKGVVHELLTDGTQ